MTEKIKIKLQQLPIKKPELFVALITLIWCWPNIINRFPIIFSDTGSYLLFSNGKYSYYWRPVFYGFFLKAILSIFHTLWVACILQTLLVTSSVYYFLKTYKPDSSKSFWLPMLTLPLITALPWCIGQIMPDFSICFSIPLCLVSLLFFEKLSTRTHLLIGASLVFSFSLHSSNVPLFVISMCACTLLLDLNKITPKIGKRFIFIFMTGLIAIVLQNTAPQNRSVSNSAYAYLVARMIDDRSLFVFLNEECQTPEKYIQLCDYKTKLETFTESNEFLWHKPDLFWSLGAFADSRNIFKEAVLRSLIHYPFLNFKAALFGVAHELFYFHMNTDRSYASSSGTAEWIEKIVPSDSPSAQAALQTRNTLLEVFSKFNLLFFFINPLSILLCFFFSFRIKVLESRNICRCALIFAVTNAFVCSFFSGSFARYQNRVSWLLVFAALLALIELHERRKRT